MVGYGWTGIPGGVKPHSRRRGFGRHVYAGRLHAEMKGPDIVVRYVTTVLHLRPEVAKREAFVDVRQVVASAERSFNFDEGGPRGAFPVPAPEANVCLQL